MSSIVGGLLLAALQAPAQFAMVSGGDTTWVPATDTIEVVQGLEITLLPVPFDAGGVRVDVGAAWWHVYDNEIYYITKEGELDAFGPGEHDLMFHWIPAGAASTAPSRMVWVVIKVVAKESG